MLVLCLDCVRNALGSAPVSGGAVALDERAFERNAAKEGALVLALNLAAMPAVLVIHGLLGQCARLEQDRDIMKRQAEQQGQFAKQLMESMGSWGSARSWSRTGIS